MLPKLILISILLLLLSFILLGIRIVLKPGGKFPDTHISNNEEMIKRGITCAQHIDTGCNPGEKTEGCATCGLRL